ncbi:MAG TPA: methyltransferase [Blastocatellia bacterium]|nr:methyltransferase [Blastocatellia bacterium]
MSTQSHAPQTDPTAVPPQFAMLQMITGFWVSQSIQVAARLGLPDLIKGQPKTAAELADPTGTHAPSLYRLLRGLASVGIFVEDAEGRFASTPLAATLETDAPGTLRWMAMAELGQEHFPAWGNLMHSIRTGEIAFDNHFGQPVWEYYAQHPEHAQNFNNAMSGMTDLIHQALLNAYDFSGITKLVDVGGGLGGQIAAILKTYPVMRGVLADQPHVISNAGPLLARAGVSERCEIESIDFFQSVPAGGDAYILKWIIHDWDDERSATILRNCRRAIADNGKLLLVETVIAPGNEPSFGKFMDLNMLVMTGGRERTEAEFSALFSRAGFRLTRIIPTESPVCVIEAVPV